MLVGIHEGQPFCDDMQVADENIHCHLHFELLIGLKAEPTGETWNGGTEQLSQKRSLKINSEFVC